MREANATVSARDLPDSLPKATHSFLADAPLVRCATRDAEAEKLTLPCRGNTALGLVDPKLELAERVNEFETPGR